jgi:hypothetical protein
LDEGYLPQGLIIVKVKLNQSREKYLLYSQYHRLPINCSTATNLEKALLVQLLASIMTSIIPNLKELVDIIKSHIGSDLIAKPEPIFSGVIGRFESILGHVNGTKEDNTTAAAERAESTDWGLLLTDTIDFLHAHKGLIQDGKSQALRIDDDIGVLIDIAHTKVTGDGLEDKSYLVGYKNACYWKGSRVVHC